MKEAPQKNKVLLVGGAGYIGSVLTGYLLNLGYSVKCLDLLLYNNKKSVSSYLDHDLYEFIHGDLTDTSLYKRVLTDVSDVVILAGLVGDPITKKYEEVALKINQTGMLSFIQSLNNKGLNKLIFISTCSNYGLIKENVTANEKFPLTPLSLYAKSKVVIEQALLSCKGQVDYSPTILRFATAFGLSPRMRFDLTVNEFTRELFLKNNLLVYDADTWRPYCHVQDFCGLIHKVLNASPDKVAFEVFNAGGEMNNCTKQMIVDKVLSVVGDVPVTYKEHGTDPRNYRVDFSKVRDVLGFEPRFSVLDGINEIVDTMKQNQFVDLDKEINFYGNYEIDYKS